MDDIIPDHFSDSFLTEQAPQNNATSTETNTIILQDDGVQTDYTMLINSFEQVSHFEEINPSKETQTNEVETKQEQILTTINNNVHNHNNTTNNLPTNENHPLQSILSQDFKISFMSFSIGDIALFVPINQELSIWMAFHSNQPHRYLAKQSLEFFLKKDKARCRILGRIVLIEPKIAVENENPYNLTLGAIYYDLYIEPLIKGIKSKKPKKVNEKLNEIQDKETISSTKSDGSFL